MNPPSTRMGTCSRIEARTRIQQAEAMLMVADVALDDETDTATPGVAAALFVLAGIAASDAASCARLGERSRGQDHRQAVDLRRSIAPEGAQMAKDLQVLLAAKDNAHYGLHLMGRAKAQQLRGRAQRLLENARAVLLG